MAAATALPPVHFLPGLLGFAVLVAGLWRDAAGPLIAMRRGTLFGTGYFLVGLYWVGIAFFADAERFGPYAVPAVLALAFGLGLTVGAACALTALRRWRRVEAQALALAAAWTLAEPLRGALGLQFPWNPVALVWTASDLTLQSVALVGTYSLSLLTVAAAGLAAAWLLPRQAASRPWATAVPLGFLLVLGLAGALRLWATPVPAATGIPVRIVQASIPQTGRWQPQERAAWLRRQAELSLLPHEPPPRVIVWPESAVPYQIERQQEVQDYLARLVPPGGVLLTGADRYQLDHEPPLASNSLYALDQAGAILGRYDKVNLVPFGEFLPFRDVLGRLGLEKLTAGSLDFVPGPGRVTLALPGLPAVGPLICYEAAFPGAATAGHERPGWLVNITNDAWFGVSSGPFQHLAMARMRAVEEGLPLIRAANNGISAVIDAHGRVLAQLGLNEVGVLDAILPAALPAPPPARFLGPFLFPCLLLGFTAFSFLVDRASRATRQPAAQATAIGR